MRTKRAPRTSEPLSAVDAAWLRMDRPENPMMITSLVMLDGVVDPVALEDTIRERLATHLRFRQRVVERFGRPRWELDPRFDVRSHLHRVAVPPPGDEAALRALVGDLMSTPLDRSRPLWEVHAVEGARGGTALVVRIHHCVADGVALVRLLLSLTDHPPSKERAVGPPPRRPVGARARLARAVAQARTLVRWLLLPHDPPTVLLGPLGVQKRAAWSHAIPLSSVTAIARGVGGTVNDVLLAAAAGALGRYLDRRGESRQGLEVRALVPVNLRRQGGGEVGGGEAGNRFGLVYLPLPLGIVAPRARLREVKRRMDEIKAAPDALVALGVLGALGLASVAMERFGVELFTRRATVMITSVPGPAVEVRLAGRVVKNLMVWAPASGQVGVTLSLLSYRGEVRLGVACDELRVADPEALVAAFEDEMSLLAEPLEGPRPAPPAPPG